MIPLKVLSRGLISLLFPFVHFSGAKTLLPHSFFAWPSAFLILREDGVLLLRMIHARVRSPALKAGRARQGSLRAVGEWPMRHPPGAQTLILGRPLVILAKEYLLSFCGKQLSSQPALFAHHVPLSQEANTGQVRKVVKGEQVSRRWSSLRLRRAHSLDGVRVPAGSTSRHLSEVSHSEMGFGDLFQPTT